MIEYKNYDRQKRRERREGWKKGPEDHDYYISLAPLSFTELPQCLTPFIPPVCYVIGIIHHGRPDPKAAITADRQIAPCEAV